MGAAARTTAATIPAWTVPCRPPAWSVEGLVVHERFAPIPTEIATLPEALLQAGT